jgi:predicted AAA+ superfamily ATPase
MRGARPPFTIDEIQYAPKLLSPIKRIADGNPGAGAVWLTGSQNFSVMEGVTETLAGRVAIVNLLGLSDEERGLRSKSPAEYFEAVARTCFPRLRGVSDRAARELYLASYVQTYVERDIRALPRIEKRREFEVFLKMCALRTGQIVNYDDLARDAGVSAVTVKDWLSLLEESFLIRLVAPYHSNRTKRLVKSPKLYFLDMGLAAYLAGWRDPEMLRLGPMGGAALETHVFGNIVRYFKHRALEAEFHFWRTRDGQEVDFLVETAGRCYPIEVKMGRCVPSALAPLGRIREPHWEKGAVVSLSAKDETAALSSEWDLLSPQNLAAIFEGGGKRR